LRGLCAISRGNCEIERYFTELRCLFGHPRQRLGDGSPRFWILVRAHEQANARERGLGLQRTLGKALLVLVEAAQRSCGIAALFLLEASPLKVGELCGDATPFGLLRVASASFYVIQGLTILTPPT
jgi:hypothetical protein